MERRYKPQKFAEMLDVSVKTLQRWDRDNRLNAYRTPTDRRYYTHAQYLAYKKQEKDRGV
jgi:DNA-binding transcriptional MerR regulator